jgi:signal transduction histidine kinase
MEALQRITEQPDGVVEGIISWAETNLREAVGVTLFLIVFVAFADWKIHPDISLGILYVLPIAFASLVFRRAHIVLLATGCTVLRETFSPSAWRGEYAARLGVGFAAFCAFGLMISEFNRNRHLVLEKTREEHNRMELQRQADKQVRILVDTSPLSFLITDLNGRILLSNDAWREFTAEEENAPEENIFTQLPGLQQLIQGLQREERPSRLEVEWPGVKKSGEAFLAHVWLTCYRTGVRLLRGSTTGDFRIAFVLWDASEDIRGREMAQSESLNTTARVLLASFSHELRNLSSAAAALISRMSMDGTLQANPDMRALASVVHSMCDFALAGLQIDSGKRRGVVDLASAMDAIRVTTQFVLEAADLHLTWGVSGPLPLVCADQASLMQVFLNLARNSKRAMHAMPDGEVIVETDVKPDAVIIRFRDTGPGVPEPDRLFKPFSPDAADSGLGLYISRTVLRSFGGDLDYDPNSPGACFTIRLVRMTRASL